VSYEKDDEHVPDTHLHDPAINDTFYPIVPFHPMGHPNLDDFVLGNGGRDGIDQFVECVTGLSENVITCTRPSE
jgi:hypothetical protein